MKNDDTDAMNNLGYYYYTEKKYDLAKKYYNKAIASNNAHAMNNIGLIYYYIDKNYEEAKKFYELACLNNIEEAYNNLGLYYSEIEKNIDIAKLYFIEAIKKQLFQAYKNLSAITIPIERYILYCQNSINYNEFDNSIDNDRLVLIFKNRLNFSGKYMECTICMNNYINIPLECEHYICVDCYPKILFTEKCPICRTEIYS